MESPANGSTVISIQGFHWQGRGSKKKPSGLLVAGSEGDLEWRYNGTKRGANWFYDVDVLENGHFLVVQTNPDKTTTVYELDPDTGERVWTETLPITDTHDVDLINGDQLLVANMRNWNEKANRNDDRIFIYDRGSDEIVWQWYVREAFPADGGGTLRVDWSHVNDVDKIAEGRYLVSVRNFDQVVVVDRERGAIVERLGADNRYDILHEQHNPSYLISEDGRPTILVADSENDRILEYERRNGTWVRTWQLSGGLSWPRDADRLPNGNTLVVDSLHHRVLEVTPRGRIVW
ncbi:MAG: aryl-sulfate sulfotransferase, partial [Halobacteriales archaeon]|nr:aryl-sulfate sulfotransferase [Halobacteriales archaeon]